MIVTLEYDTTVATIQDNDGKGPRILSWEEETIYSPAIKKIPSKLAGFGLMEKEVYTTSPTTIMLKCRIPLTEKEILKTLQETQNASNVVLLKKDAVTYKSVWINNVELSWEGNFDYTNNWVATIELKVI